VTIDPASATVVETAAGTRHLGLINGAPDRIAVWAARDGAVEVCVPL
jgi:hypothetical protein